MDDIAKRLMHVTFLYDLNYVSIRISVNHFYVHFRQVYVLKPRCKSDVLSSKTIENNAPEDTQVLLPTSTLLNDVEIEIESSLQSGRAKEIIMDNIDSEHLVTFKIIILLKLICSVMHFPRD